MRAAFYEGSQRFRIGDCSPVPPGPAQVQIRVSHCGICGTDLHVFQGHMDDRVRVPQVIGHEMSGAVAAVGDGVSGFAPGDRVTVRPLDYCGSCPACRAGHSHICQKLKVLGVDAPGAMQGLWTVPARTLHRTPGEYVVVQGGGPIGSLIALLARREGARVLVSEVNPFRRKLAGRLGLEAVNPRKTDLLELVNSQTEGAGADVVFEVTGSASGAESMAKLPRTRGRVVVVAIFAEPPKVDLFRFFWREVRMTGARVYEPEDFEKAIEVAASGALPLGSVITDVLPLEGVDSAFRQLESGGEVMKILIRCGD